VAYEYDPDNLLRHVDYWFEDDIKSEWPQSVYSDPNANPDEYNPTSEAETFYFSVETTGSRKSEDIMWSAIQTLKQKLGIVFYALGGSENAGVAGAPAVPVANGIYRGPV
jgi:DNA-directed RNA polymerase II subunit RPB3